MSKKEPVEFSMQVDLKELIAAMEFAQEGVPAAILEQAKLLLHASYYRVTKMKARMKAEASLSETQTQVALTIRTDTEVKITENYVREQTEVNPEVIAAKKAYDDAKAMEEWAKAIVDSYQMRGSMLKAYVQLLGFEMATESGLIRTQLEELGVGKLKRDVQKKYPGRT